MFSVLLIDGNEDGQIFVQQTLEVQGYGVRWASDVDRGLALARACPPDVILVDTDLPDLDRLVRRCRIDPQHRLFHVPMIVFTTYAQRGMALDLLAAGCDRYLIKPVTIHELWTEVAYAIQQGHPPHFPLPYFVRLPSGASAEIFQHAMVPS